MSFVAVWQDRLEGTMNTSLVTGKPSLTIRFSYARGTDPNAVQLPSNVQNVDLPTSAPEVPNGIKARYEIGVSVVNSPNTRFAQFDNGVSVEIGDGSLTVYGDDYDAVYARYQAELQTLTDYIVKRD